MTVRSRAVPVNALAFAGVALLAALGLTACTGAPAPSPSPSASEQVNGLPDGVASPSDVPTDVPNDPDARQNVVIDSCEATANGWRAAGSAVNPGESDVAYEISVFFTTASGTVIGFGGTTAGVEPDGSANWSVEAEFVAPDETLCVLRGVAEVD